MSLSPSDFIRVGSGYCRSGGTVSDLEGELPIALIDHLVLGGAAASGDVAAIWKRVRYKVEYCKMVPYR